MEVTVQVVNVQAAHVAPPKIWATSLDDVPNTDGTKIAATASSHTNLEEMLTPCFTTPMVPLMSDFGKLTNQTGHHAVEEKPHAISKPTLTVLSRSINGEETPGSSGALILLVDADVIENL